MARNRRESSPGIVQRIESIFGFGSPRGPSPYDPLGSVKSPGDPKYMGLSPTGRAFIQGSEKFRANVYDDGYGNPTIGYGHLLHSWNHAPITEEQAQKLFDEDAANVQQAIGNKVTAPLNQNQYDALVSYGFNAGTGRIGTLAKNLNEGDYDGALNKLMSGPITSGGVKSQGLINRRAAEAALWNGTYQSSDNGLKGVQQRLKAAGFDPGPIDGQMGPQTQAALDAAREAQVARARTTTQTGSPLGPPNTVAGAFDAPGPMQGHFGPPPQAAPPPLSPVTSAPLGPPPGYQQPSPAEVLAATRGPSALQPPQFPSSSRLPVPTNAPAPVRPPDALAGIGPTPTPGAGPPAPLPGLGPGMPLGPTPVSPSQIQIGREVSQSAIGPPPAAPSLDVRRAQIGEMATGMIARNPGNAASITKLMAEHGLNVDGSPITRTPVPSVSATSSLGMPPSGAASAQKPLSMTPPGLSGQAFGPPPGPTAQAQRPLAMTGQGVPPGGPVQPLGPPPGAGLPSAGGIPPLARQAAPPPSLQPSMPPAGLSQVAPPPGIIGTTPPAGQMASFPGKEQDDRIALEDVWSAPFSNGAPVPKPASFPMPSLAAPGALAGPPSLTPRSVPTTSFGPPAGPFVDQTLAMGGPPPALGPPPMPAVPLPAAAAAMAPPSQPPMAGPPQYTVIGRVGQKDNTKTKVPLAAKLAGAGAGLLAGGIPGAAVGYAGTAGLGHLLGLQNQGRMIGGAFNPGGNWNGGGWQGGAGGYGGYGGGYYSGNYGGWGGGNINQGIGGAFRNR